MKRMRNRTGIILGLLLLVIAVSACSIGRLVSAPDSVAAKDFRVDLDLNTCVNEERKDAVVRLFASKNLGLEEDRYERVTNLRYETNPKAEKIIVVGAHYDKTTLGCGAIDNWTGLVILSRLAQTRKDERDINYVFIAFGEEEKGLWGSKAYLNSRSADKRESICAMINLDSFGFDPVWALKSISTRKMLMLASDLRRNKGGSFSIRSYRRATSDSEPFFKAGIESITFSGLGDDWRDYLHQETDQMENVDVESVVENHAFVDEFLNLKAKECGS